MFSQGAFMKVWEIKGETTSSGKVIYKARMSSSKKNQDGSYITDWSGFATLVGKAAQVAQNIGDGARIKLLNCGVTTNYKKESNTVYTNYSVFDCEIVDTGNAAPAPVSAQGSADTGFLNVPDGVVDELPFN